MFFSQRIGFATVVSSTRSRRIGPLLAAIRPAKPTPTGTRTPWRTSSSMPRRDTGDELTRRSVEEQHCRSVGLEDVTHREQLDKEVVDVEARERGVGDRLESRQALFESCSPAPAMNAS